MRNQYKAKQLNAFRKEMGIGQQMRKLCSINIPNAYVQPPIGFSDRTDNKRLMTNADIF